MIPTWILWAALIYGFVMLGYICMALTSINDETKRTTAFLAMLVKR